MKTDIVPEVAAKYQAAADKLAQSAADSIVIEDIDNRTLVKLGSTSAANLEAGMLLYPYKHNGDEYLVCITTAR